MEVSARSFTWKGDRRVVCSCRDISDRKKLEQDTLDAKKLAEDNQKRFEEIATHTGEFFWEVDANGKYTYANLAVKTMLGYDPEELIGKKTYLDLVSNEEKKWVALEVKKSCYKKPRL